MIPPQTLTIGPVTLYFYSLFILAGIVGGFLLGRKEARRFKISGEELAISVFYALIPGFVGARLYHVLDEWAYYGANPADILATWQGGLGILGGLAGGLFGLWLFARRYRKPLLRVLDIWAPSVLFAQGLGRFGNWTNQEAFGPPTDVPWGVFIDPARRPDTYATAEHFHPTFFYEAGIDFLGLALLLWLRPKLRATPGRVLGAYLVIYGIGRFVVEFYRFDTATLGQVKVAHVLALGLVVTGAYLIRRR